MIFEWRTRLTAKRMSHLFVDGECACTNGRKPVGSTSPYQGRTVQPFGPAELSADGRPFGLLCRQCETRWQKIRPKAGATR
jgi:hypothetical protein